jgi:protein-disulfide isomerase-like protein with CxxC motif
MIQELQEELQTHVQRYEEHVVEEVDPTTADRLREIDAEIDLRADAAQLLAAQVQRERQSQEQQLLQTCRRLHGSARVPTRSAHTPPTPTSARAAIPQPHKGHARARMSSQSTFPRKATAKASD